MVTKQKSKLTSWRRHKNTYCEEGWVDRGKKQKQKKLIKGKVAWEEENQELRSVMKDIEGDGFKNEEKVKQWRDTGD